MLPRREVEQLQQWIENFLEDQFEIPDEFAVRIDRGKKDIAKDNVRVRESDVSPATEVYSREFDPFSSLYRSARELIDAKFNTPEGILAS